MRWEEIETSRKTTDPEITQYTIYILWYCDEDGRLLYKGRYDFTDYGKNPYTYPQDTIDYWRDHVIPEIEDGLKPNMERMCACGVQGTIFFPR